MRNLQHWSSPRSRTDAVTGNPASNYARRIIGIVLCTAPISLAAASLISGLGAASPGDTGGIGWIILAAAIASFNGYLSFLRPWLYRQRHEGSMEGFRFISGFPLIGSLAVMIGVIFSWGHLYSAILGALVSVVDTGGTPAFLIVTWRDRSFWGDRAS